MRAILIYLAIVASTAFSLTVQNEASAQARSFSVSDERQTWKQVSGVEEDKEEKQEHIVVEQQTSQEAVQQPQETIVQERQKPEVLEQQRQQAILQQQGVFRLQQEQKQQELLQQKRRQELLQQQHRAVLEQERQQEVLQQQQQQHQAILQQRRQQELLQEQQQHQAILQQRRQQELLQEQQQHQAILQQRRQQELLQEQQQHQALLQQRRQQELLQQQQNQAILQQRRQQELLQQQQHQAILQQRRQQELLQHQQQHQAILQQRRQQEALELQQQERQQELLHQEGQEGMYLQPGSQKILQQHQQALLQRQQQQALLQLRQQQQALLQQQQQQQYLQRQLALVQQQRKEHEILQSQRPQRYQNVPDLSQQHRQQQMYGLSSPMASASFPESNTAAVFTTQETKVLTTEKNLNDDSEAHQRFAVPVVLLGNNWGGTGGRNNQMNEGYGQNPQNLQNQRNLLMNGYNSQNKFPVIYRSANPTTYPGNSARYFYEPRSFSSTEYHPFYSVVTYPRPVAYGAKPGLSYQPEAFYSPYQTFYVRQGPFNGLTSYFENGNFQRGISCSSCPNSFSNEEVLSSDLSPIFGSPSSSSSFPPFSIMKDKTDRRKVFIVLED